MLSLPRLKEQEDVPDWWDVVRIELEMKEEEFKVLDATCDRKGLNTMECLQDLLSGAIESFLEDCALD